MQGTRTVGKLWLTQRWPFLGGRTGDKKRESMNRRSTWKYEHEKSGESLLFQTFCLMPGRILVGWSIGSQKGDREDKITQIRGSRMGEGIWGAKECEPEQMALGEARLQPHCGKVTRPQGGQVWLSSRETVQDHPVSWRRREQETDLKYDTGKIAILGLLWGRGIEYMVTFTGSFGAYWVRC